MVVKFFVHVTKEAQRKRLTRLRRDPATAWRVSDDGKMATIGEYEEAYRLYDNLLEGGDVLVRAVAPDQRRGQASRQPQDHRDTGRRA